MNGKRFKEDKVTAVLHIYNEEQFLREALESVIDQVDYVIVTDNASTDGTEAICRDFAEKYPHVIYFRNEKNLGSYENMNSCIQKVQTEFFFGLDGHDIVPKNYVSSLKKKLRETEDALGAYSDRHVMELNGSVHQMQLSILCKTFFDNKGRSMPEYTMLTSPMERAANVYLAVWPDNYWHALYRTESTLHYWQQCKAENPFNVFFNISLKGKMVYCEDTVYYRRNTRPVGTHNDFLQNVLGEQFANLKNSPCRGLGARAKNTLNLFLGTTDPVLSDNEKLDIISRLYIKLRKDCEIKSSELKCDRKENTFLLKALTRLDKQNKLIVVYVCRYQDEDSFGKFVRFFESYKRHSVGYEHDLFIIKKGFQEHEEIWNRWTRHLDNISYQIRAYPDRHFVFGYIRNLMEEFPDRYILVCNTSSEILVDNWLDLYMRHANPERVLGACGAYQSPVPDSESCSQIPRLSWKAFCRSSRRTRKMWLYSALGFPTDHLLSSTVIKHSFWNINNYYPFPNPYLRSNAFMVPPRFLELIPYWPKSELLQTKEDEWFFESSNFGFSCQVIMAGLELLVVGANGRTYTIQEWPTSNTFCDGDQQNLIIADGHCRSYKNGSVESRQKMRAQIWGSKENYSCEVNDFIALNHISNPKNYMRLELLKKHENNIMPFHELVSKVNLDVKEC